MLTYRQFLASISPPWLLKPNGFGVKWVQGILGLTADFILSAAAQAVKVGWIARATVPSDALRHIGDNLDIDQVPGESNAAYRTRLGTGWELWQEAATSTFAANALAPFGVAASAITLRANADWRADPRNPDAWSRFWIVLGPASLPWTDATWGGDPWDLWGSPGSWGTNAPLTTVGGVIAQINQWKSAHEVGVQAILLFPGGAIYGIGTWGAPRLWDINNVVRWQLGRFWGTKYPPYTWGDLEPYRPTLAAAWGGKIRI